MAVFLSQTLRLKYLRLLCIFYHSKAGKYILYFAFFITLFITLVRGVAETSFLQGFQARLINVRLPYRVQITNGWATLIRFVIHSQISDDRTKPGPADQIGIFQKAHGEPVIHFPQTSLPTLLAPVPSSFV